MKNLRLFVFISCVLAAPQLQAQMSFRLKSAPVRHIIYRDDRLYVSEIEKVWGRNQPTGLAVSPDGKLLAFTDFLDMNLELYRIEQ